MGKTIFLTSFKVTCLKQEQQCTAGIMTHAEMKYMIAIEQGWNGKSHSCNIPIYTGSGIILIQANCDKSGMHLLSLEQL